MAKKILNEIALIDSLDDLKVIKKLVNKKIKLLTPTKKALIPGYSRRALSLANLLWSRVHENYPIIKMPDFGVWASDIDKINRIDGHDEKLIEALLEWSQKDEFWKAQIRSGAALRRHFEKLYVAAKKEYDYTKNKKGGVHVI